MPEKIRDLPERIRELIPLSPAVFFVLFALVDGDKHGYAIMKEVAILSDRKVRMGPATLYTTIQRLLDLRLIEETSRKTQADARRRYYRLTGTGKKLFEIEIERLDSVIHLAQKRRLALRNAQ